MSTAQTAMISQPINDNQFPEAKPKRKFTPRPTLENFMNT